MEIFLAILIVLGIFVVAPVIIAFIYVGVVSGLFQVIRHSRRRRVIAPQGRGVRMAEETVIGKVT